MTKQHVQMRQAQQVVEVNPHAVTGIRTFIALFGKALRLKKNIGIVPVDENAVHIEYRPSESTVKTTLPKYSKN